MFPGTRRSWFTPASAEAASRARGIPAAKQTARCLWRLQRQSFPPRKALLGEFQQPEWFETLHAKVFMDTYVCIAPDVKLGQDVKLSKFINLYGCEIGDETKIGAFVEIQKNATVGQALQDLQPYLHLRRRHH